MRTLETDYLVVGAGAMGMAFTDALVDHADVHVTLVDRRHGPGGHWQDAYPFVQLHQASLFYGVASTVLGTGAVQRTGPETGLQERARRSEVQAYYDEVLHRRFLTSGRVTFLGGHEHLADGGEHVVVSRVTGERTSVVVRRRVVDAAYLSPAIPATTPPPFGVADGAPVIPVGALGSIVDGAPVYVIVGSGKTATDAIVWLLRNGLDPERIVWIRPREPWMLDRARVQPDPVVATGLSADVMEASEGAASLDEVLLRLEDLGVLLRIDRQLVPTMARTPTLGTWELELLRTVEGVVRMGHVRGVSAGAVVLDGGVVPLPAGAVVVHCAAAGLQNPPSVPIWSPDGGRLQTTRVGFPCFCAALAGYVEATRDDDRERNRLCPPNIYGNTREEWARMQVQGSRASARFLAEPDIAAWADSCALNPGHAAPEQRATAAFRAEADRLGRHAPAGLARLAELAGLDPPTA